MRKALNASDNKYIRGVVAVVAGSERYPGAAILTVGGARRGNAGYVKFCSRSKHLQDLVIERFPDVVPIEDLENQRLDALVLGPGMDEIDDSLFLAVGGIPLVLDGVNIDRINQRGFVNDHPITVITPHEGEVKFAGVEITSPLSDDERKRVALQIARESGVITVLKGHRTVVAEPEGETFIDDEGGPELATAGSGDLLAGLIGSFLVGARDINNAMDLVARAVTLHSRAGKWAREKYRSVTALEILEGLAQV
ncbi:MAG: ADP-dependent NAD(P)H-hydrate dehydratase [Candidatus Nanopelagicaceae bacterium]